MLNVSASRSSSNTASGNLIQRLNSLPRETRDTLWLLAVVALVISPLTPHVPPWTMPWPLVISRRISIDIRA